MSRISLGKTKSGTAWLEIDELIRTRLLIQGNSGSGKSWLIRRLCEQLFGKIPVLVIDPEGEFATLREKYGYVLVGKGGEAAAHLETAGLLAHRLLELGASAVCDIYELKPQARHEWVRRFLEALVDAPKELWKPTLVIVDEAHVYAPEKGQGESIAHGAMVDLATRGRKRGFCLVPATQRLSKLAKNLSAEMLNRLVGMTFEDVDLDRAADLMSVPRSERIEFQKEMRGLEPGYFYGLGRAISKERVLIQVGPVETTHPKPGSASVSTPPPAPEKVKALLPKLADLPKEAETKAKTEKELRQEIVSLRAQLAQAQRKPAPAPQVKPVEIEKRVQVPVLTETQLKRLENIVDRIEISNGKVREVSDKIAEAFCRTRDSLKKNQAPLPARRSVGPFDAVSMGIPIAKKAIAKDYPADTFQSDDGELSNPQLRQLQGLVELGLVGKKWVPRTMLAGWLGLSLSGSFKNNFSNLRSRGLIEYGPGGDLGLTDLGRKAAPAAALDPTNAAVLDRCCQAVSGPQTRMLRHLHSVYPEWVDREELAAVLGVTMSGSFKNGFSGLHSAGMIEYGSGSEKNKLRVSDWLFVEGAPVPV